jgi:dihydroorotate dehydrogenase
MSLFRLATRALHVLEPEDAHKASLLLLSLASGTGLGPGSNYHPPELKTGIAYDGGRLDLPNCLGLAAGYDKDADVPLAMLRAGFGLVECGTVTPRPQAGNARPRLYRLSEDEAVINRMGFNNKGLDVFSDHLARARSHAGRDRASAVIGANIGANKDSPDPVADYVTGLKRLWGQPSYFTLNISSPNTPGLRSLQSRAALDNLLSAVSETRSALKAATGQNVPVFLKIAPDLDEGEIADTVEGALKHALDGVIVSNTTISRPGTLRSNHADETGGLSGAPLFHLSTWALKVAHEVSRGRLMLIGAGGVASGAEAYAKIRAGASLVQLYSALVYKGPDLIDAIKRDLVVRLRADGFAQVSQAVGIGH